MKRQIEQDIGAFIVDYIDSVHTLEVLLMLHRDPSRVWTTDTIHEHVQSSPSAVKASLLSLMNANLARQPSSDRDGFMFHAPSVLLDERVRALATLYENRRTLVIEYIYSRPTKTKAES
ncbi:MAG TPA: hypothetical protein VFT72_08665 [Opitutaceae bacterium]|nr:hypothetical protein [Opitutaceae bacterium]